ARPLRHGSVLGEANGNQRAYTGADVVQRRFRESPGALFRRALAAGGRQRARTTDPAGVPAGVGAAARAAGIRRHAGVRTTGGLGTDVPRDLQPERIRLCRLAATSLTRCRAAE